MYCRFCGVEQPEGSLYCFKCGKDATGKLTKTEEKELKKVEEKAQLEVEEMEFLGTKEVAALLKCSVPTARELMYRKDFPMVKVGKNMRVEKGALRKWASEKHNF